MLTMYIVINFVLGVGKNDFLTIKFVNLCENNFTTVEDKKIKVKIIQNSTLWAFISYTYISRDGYNGVLQTPDS